MRRGDYFATCAAVDRAGRARRLSQIKSGHTNAPIASVASTAETGRSKNGSRLPSDLMSDVTKLCSNMVPITMPSTVAATG